MSTAVRSGKSQAAFRTISEVAGELDVAQHVLRFWESKFPQVRPLKRGGGRRYYRPEDIELLRDIRSLLYDEGYTIKGAQKLLRQRRAKPQAPAKSTDPSNGPPAGPSASQADLQRAASDPPQSGSSVGTEVGHARPNGVAPASTGARHSSDPVPSSAAGPDAGPTAVGTTVDEVEKLHRLRAELVELRRAVADALASTDR